MESSKFEQHASLADWQKLKNNKQELVKNTLKHFKSVFGTTLQILGYKSNMSVVEIKATFFKTLPEGTMWAYFVASFDGYE